MAAPAEPRNEQQLVEFLRRLLSERIPLVRCEYDPKCPSAYAYPLAQEFFGIENRNDIATDHRPGVEQGRAPFR